MALLTALPAWVGWMFAAVAAFCAITDFRSDKIYNKVTLPAAFLGLAFVLAFVPGQIGNALLGVALGFGFFFVLFFFGIMGAGDAKLVMALATVLGVHGTWELILNSFFIGGMGAVAILIAKKRVRVFFSEIYYFFRSLFIKELEVHWPKLDKNTKAPFGVAIFIAYLVIFLGANQA